MIDFHHFPMQVSLKYKPSLPWRSYHPKKNIHVPKMTK